MIKTGASRFLISSFGLLTILFFMTVGASAQQVEISSTLNPAGSGARATGLGGAFISVADDATAASWNPAGLIHLEKPEISVVGSYFSRAQTYHSDIHPEDASYQFRFGRSVTGDVLSIPGSSADVNQHMVMMSLIYYF